MKTKDASNKLGPKKVFHGVPEQDKEKTFEISNNGFETKIWSLSKLVVLTVDISNTDTEGSFYSPRVKQ